MQKSSFYNSNTHKITGMKQHICVEKWKNARTSSKHAETSAESLDFLSKWTSKVRVVLLM